MMMNNLPMEDFGCLWNYEENIEELKDKVLVMTYELESTRKQANEEMKKNEDKLLQLLNLVQTAYKERDEARDQLQKLVSYYKTTTAAIPTAAATSDHHHHHFLNNNSTPKTVTTASFTPLSPQSPLLIPTTKAVAGCNNSSTTASNSPSVDSFFDPPAVSSPEFSTFNLAVDSATNYGNHHTTTTTTTTGNNPLNFINHEQQQSLIHDFSSNLPPLAPTPLTTTTTTTTAPSPRTASIPANKPDQASVIISNLAKGRPLPQKGRLLQAVMEAGPLLQTLMVAGPLPRWRNPPPVQPLQIPPFQTGSFGSSDSTGTVLLSGLNSPHVGSAPAAKRSYDSMISSSGNLAQVSCGGSSQQMYHGNNMLNFGGSNSTGGGSMVAGLSTGAGAAAAAAAGGRMMMMTMMSGSSGVDNLINNQISSMQKRQRIL